MNDKKFDLVPVFCVSVYFVLIWTCVRVSDKAMLTNGVVYDLLDLDLIAMSRGRVI